MIVSDVISARREIAAGRSKAPKVSIVTPTYKRNLEGLLAPCIESALGQTFSDIELIIIDDGSSDGTEDTVRLYAKQDDRIRYYRHDRNSGLPAVRTNEGIMLARGEAVAFLFDDNVLTKDFIEQAQDALLASQVDVIHANVHMLGKDGADFILGDWPLARELLGNLNTIPNGGVLCRTDFFDRYGLYDPHILLRRICDWDLWLRAAHLGARFQHLDIVAATEHGLVSENSIGNTIAWDVKVAYGYMFDTMRYAERAAQLRPSEIARFDVLDTACVLPYVRNATEWSDVERQIYLPFADRNAAAAGYTTSLTNRAELDHFGFRLSASPSPNAGRRRTLIVANTYNEHVQQWESALADAQNICIHTPEWQLSAIQAEDVDLLILADACAPFIAPLVQKFVEAGVAVLYSSQFGFAPTDAPEVGFQQYPPIKKALGADMYLPGDNVPFSPDQADWARGLMGQATSVVLRGVVSDVPNKWTIEAPDAPSPEWLRNVATTTMYARARKAGSVTQPKAVVALNSELLSGSEAYGAMLAKGLSDSGFDVEIWIPANRVYGVSDDALAQRLSDLGLAAARAASYEPGARFLSQPEDIRRELAAALSRDIAGSGPDLIVCSGFMPVFAWADRQQAKMLAGLFQPSAYNPADLCQLHGRIDGWVSDSKWSHDMTAQVLPGPSGVARSTVPAMVLKNQHPTEKPTQLRIAVGGTLQPRKGQLESVKALRLLLDQGHDAILNLYGYALPSLEAYRREIEKTVFDLDLKGRVRILGFASLDVLAAENDIILSASRDESLPQTLAESIARGLIPVASLAGGMDELVLDGVNGFIAINYSPERLAEALDRAIAAKSDWPALRAQSAGVLAAFTSEKANAVVLQVLLKALETPRTQACERMVSPSPTQWTIPESPERKARLAGLTQLKASLSKQNGTALR